MNKSPAQPRVGLVRVDDLLRSPALQLTVLAGGGGVMRRIAWAHVSELADPTPWLSGAELIMTTGLAMPKSATGQCAYLARLDDAGVAALALSEGLYVPRLTQSFLDEADHRNFPVVEVPISVPFMAVAQEVAAAVSLDTSRRVNAQLQVFGAVRWLATDDLSSREIFSRLERLSGYRLYACNPRGGELLAGVPVPPADRVGLVPETASSPPTVSGGCVVPVAGPSGHAGWVLALERPRATPAGLAVVQHIATVAALRLAMIGQQREAWRREGAETFSEMLQSPMDPARIARRLGHHGFVKDADVVLAIAAPHEVFDDDAIARLLAHAGHPHLLLRVQDDLYVLLPATGGALDSLRESTTAPLGTSRPFRAEESMALAVREARWAVRAAIERGEPTVAYGDDPTVRWLTDDAPALQGLIDDVLGAVASYDLEHSAMLLATARTWLELDRRNDLAAEVLHVHRNTLVYRLRRFEEISGRSLNSTQGIAEVWLALRATAQEVGGANLQDSAAGTQHLTLRPTGQTARSGNPTTHRQET